MSKFSPDKLRPGRVILPKVAAGFMSLILAGGVPTRCGSQSPDITPSPLPSASAKQRPYCGSLDSNRLYGESRLIGSESLRLLMGDNGPAAQRRELRKVAGEIDQAIGKQGPPEDLELLVSVGLGFAAVEGGQAAEKEAGALAEMFSKELRDLAPPKYISGEPNTVDRPPDDGAVIIASPTNCKPLIQYSPLG